MYVVRVDGIVKDKVVSIEIIDALLCQETLQSRIVGVKCRALSVP